MTPSLPRTSSHGFTPEYLLCSDVVAVTLQQPDQILVSKMCKLDESLTGHMSLTCLHLFKASDTLRELPQRAQAQNHCQSLYAAHRVLMLQQLSCCLHCSQKPCTSSHTRLVLTHMASTISQAHMPLPVWHLLTTKQ